MPWEVITGNGQKGGRRQHILLALRFHSKDALSTKMKQIEREEGRKGELVTVLACAVVKRPSFAAAAGSAAASPYRPL